MKRCDIYCDWCNPEHRADADEGYVQTAGELPRGWWEVPTPEGLKHSCERCALGPAREAIIKHRDAETARLLA